MQDVVDVLDWWKDTEFNEYVAILEKHNVWYLLVTKSEDSDGSIQ